MSRAVPAAGPHAGARVHAPAEPFILECGRTLEDLRIAYETWGELNGRRDNAVLVLHTLTAGAHAAASNGVPGWWDGLIGPGRPVDPKRHFVVCANLPGSCYGTTGPSAVDPATGLPYGAGFPVVTTRDMARAQMRLLEHLGVGELELAVGGSLGAMVLWEFLAEHPGVARRAVAVAGPPRATPWTVAFNEVARRAVVLDPAWAGGRYTGEGPVEGLALARMIAMISYRAGRGFGDRFGLDREVPYPFQPLEAANRFQVERYLERQGEKFVGRFDARSYLALIRAMDLHDVCRDRGPLQEALGDCGGTRLLAVGIASDNLVEPAHLREAVGTLRAAGARACYAELDSADGHDAFLTEPGPLNRIINDFIEGGTSCTC